MTLFLALLLFAAPPDTLHLASCYRDAEAHDPLRRQIALRATVADLRVETLNTRSLPSVAVRGQAVYYSDVPGLAVALPGLPQLKHDQYKVGLTIDQLVYDGGVIAQQKALEYLQRDLDQEQVAVESYRLREQINGAFLGVLLFEAQQDALRTLEADLRARLGTVEAQVTSGVVLPSGADVLRAELIKNAQQHAESAANRRAALDVLGTLIGRPLPDDVVLALPEVAVEAAGPEARRRPEYRLFDVNRGLLARQAALSARKNRPVVSGFAEAAYGRPPGLNFFENTLTPFFSAGLRFTWNAWDWHTGRREREASALQQAMIDVQEEAFTRQITVAVQQQRQDIRRLEDLLRSDGEIIALRRRIAAQAASQLEHGVITATDYLAERNATHQAELTQQVHRIQLVQARVHYLTTIGEE